MPTYDVRIGASYPLVFQLEDEAGAPVPLTGTALELRISTGTACIVLPGVIVGDRFQVSTDSLDLPPRLYPAAIYFDQGEGLMREGEILINVLGGC